MKTVKPDLSSLWIRMSVEDDVKSFEALYYALFNKLFKFCCYYVTQKEIAEDIISEIFVKCWENRKVNLHVTNPETYLFVAVRNQSLKHLKKYSGIRITELELSGEYPFSDNNNPEKELERKELHVKLDSAIEKLPLQAKMVFRLIKENGMRYKEVAEILDISPRTVQTQLFRAIDKLRVTLFAYKEGKDQSGNNDKLISGKIISLIFLISITNYFLEYCRHF
ncbi:RNA polymerase sigma-70 factor [Pedobacter sp. B4-66]|uniref:RNA polymerase sigma-70 factor n=1 Tax=Pedobacter sp. B4-66 TaxID=2817280 RepID=UPI001BD92C8A|nr:RNA polymerase sigma-70 factor [Pedobacter sp. B4-66]